MRGSAAAVACIALSSCVLAETTGARSVSDHRARIQGRLFNDQPGPAEQWVEYGTTPSYGTSTPHAVVATVEDGWLETSAELGGLSSGTTYHYRFCGVARGAGGPGSCGEDHLLTTGSGRRAVWGDAVYDISPSSGAEASLDAASDPTPGYLDGDASITGRAPGTPTHPEPVRWGGGSAVTCVRVAGKVATVGFSFADPLFGTRYVALVVEDNGVTGDRFDAIELGSPGCPTPSSALIGTGLVGRTTPVTAGDLHVDATA